MRVALRVVVLLLIFVGVGWMAAHGVMRHAADHAQNTAAMQPEVRLAAEMAGLFAGGAATLIAGIAILWSRDKF